jgi:hypothetical protein
MARTNHTAIIIMRRIDNTWRRFVITGTRKSFFSLSSALYPSGTWRSFFSLSSALCSAL